MEKTDRQILRIAIASTHPQIAQLVAVQHNRHLRKLIMCHLKPLRLLCSISLAMTSYLYNRQNKNDASMNKPV